MANTIYSVTISPFATSGASQGGFIDPKSVPQYGLIEGLTFDQCKDKKRANQRWLDIVESLSLEANAFIANVVATGATVDKPATSLSFNVSYQAGGQPAILRDGVMLTGADAIKRMVAEALITPSNDQCEVFDPYMTDPIDSPYHYQGVIVSHLACGPRFMILDVGALASSVADALAHITVTA